MADTSYVDYYSQYIDTHDKMNNAVDQITAYPCENLRQEVETLKTKISNITVVDWTDSSGEKFKENLESCKDKLDIIIESIQNIFKKSEELYQKTLDEIIKLKNANEELKNVCYNEKPDKDDFYHDETRKHRDGEEYEVHIFDEDRYNNAVYGWESRISSLKSFCESVISNIKTYMDALVAIDACEITRAANAQYADGTFQLSVIDTDYDALMRSLSSDTGSANSAYPEAPIDELADVDYQPDTYLYADGSDLKNAFLETGSSEGVETDLNSYIRDGFLNPVGEEPYTADTFDESATYRFNVSDLIENFTNNSDWTEEEAREFIEYGLNHGYFNSELRDDLNSFVFNDEEMPAAAAQTTSASPRVDSLGPVEYEPDTYFYANASDLKNAFLETGSSEGVETDLNSYIRDGFLSPVGDEPYSADHFDENATYKFNVSDLVDNFTNNSDWNEEEVNEFLRNGLNKGYFSTESK